jgi:hypothetical protein
VQSQQVTVPGEEDQGVFYNATIALPSAGTWEFSVPAGEETASYTIEVREP